MTRSRHSGGVCYTRSMSNTHTFMFQRVFALMLLFLLWDISNSQAETYAALIAADNGFVSVHQAPFLSSPVVGKIFAGEDLAVFETQNNWCRIASNSKDDTWIKGFVPKTSIKRVNSRDVIVNGRHIRYRLVLDPSKTGNLPEAKPTDDRAYAINPYSGEKMYLGFLRSQAIVTDPNTGREFAYTRMTTSQTQRVDHARMTDQEQERIAKRQAIHRAEQILGGIVTMSQTPDRYSGTGYHTCRACGGSGYRGNSEICSRCGGSGKIKDGSGDDDY